MQNQDLIIRALKSRIRTLNIRIEALESENASLKGSSETLRETVERSRDFDTQLQALLADNVRLSKENDDLKSQLQDKPVVSSKPPKKTKAAS